MRVRFRRSAITPTRARWEQAFSVDAGATWEANWIRDFQRLLGDIHPKGRSLSREPGKTNERSTSLRMASDSAAAYGQIH